MPELTLARLKEVFILDRANWVLIWRFRKGPTAPAGGVAGYINNNGYRMIQVDGAAHCSHRLIYAYARGRFPSRHLDHKNHIRDDNRINNLRLATRSINSKNRTMNTNNTSGVTGVYWSKAHGKWRVRIGVRGRLLSLGLFTNKKEAIKVRRRAEKKHGFHANHGRK